MASQDQISQFSQAILSRTAPFLEPQDVIPAAGQLLRCRCFGAPFIKQRLCHNLCGAHCLHGHSIPALVVSHLNLLANILQCFRRTTPSHLNHHNILHLHLQDVPPHHIVTTLLRRNHLLESLHPRRLLQRAADILSAPVKFHRSTHGNRIPNFTTLAKSMAWISP